MIGSYRQIAAIMDPAAPATSLKALAAEHRWVDNVDPQNVPLPVSFRTIAERHSEPANTARLLGYNTQLLWGSKFL